MRSRRADRRPSGAAPPTAPTLTPPSAIAAGFGARRRRSSRRRSPPSRRSRAARSRPGVREVTFADGSIYRGAMRGTSLHGKGEYVSKAFKYEGEFIDGPQAGRRHLRLGQRRPLRRATSRRTAPTAAASTSSPTATRTRAR